MSFFDVSDANLFTVFGFTLNTEEKASLSRSLLLKKDQEKLSNISLFGKILGTQADYLIAQSHADSFFDRKSFYSYAYFDGRLDNVNWLQLPDVTATDIKKAESIQARFTGDPSHEFTASKYVLDLEPNDDRKLREEKRLAAVIHAINVEAQVVPRGAYYRDSNNKLLVNPTFTGLNEDEIHELSSYFHFREGFEVSTKTLSERINKFDESIDVFEAIDSDEPKGIWALQAESGGAVSILRSFAWPGYSFVHTPGTGKFAGFYHGTGQKNANAGYML